jgi:hypothetical protein
MGKGKIMSITPEVLAMNEIHFAGNVTPAKWYKHLKYDSGKPNLNAIIILAEIVYWYRPSEVRDEETGQLLGYKKKFKADKLQRSHKSFSDQFGLTKKQVRDALTFLEDKGLITKELRNINTQGLSLSNVLFIGIVPARIKAITLEVTPMTSKSHPPNIEVTPSPPESQTYTKTTTGITTNFLENSKLENGFAQNSQNLIKPDDTIETKLRKTQKTSDDLLKVLREENSFDRTDQTERDNLNFIADQIANTCGNINLLTAHPATKKEIKRIAISFYKMNITPDDLKAFDVWWYDNTWQGKKRQAPTLKQLGDTWGQFEGAKVAPTNNPEAGPALSDEAKANYARLLAEQTK